MAWETTLVGRPKTERGEDIQLQPSFVMNLKAIQILESVSSSEKKNTEKISNPSHVEKN